MLRNMQKRMGIDLIRPGRLTDIVKIMNCMLD